MSNQLPAGRVFSLSRENPSAPGCTISGELLPAGARALVVSMAPGTDISAERYPVPALYLVLRGRLRFFSPEEPSACPAAEAGDLVWVRAHATAGVAADRDTAFVELLGEEDTDMNVTIPSGEVFRLTELVPYQDGRIVNRDVVKTPKMKLAVMSFDAGCALAEHAAPGEAVIFALDGEGVICYEGEDHPIGAGENFVFAKGGLHAVRAENRFKMALLLMLE
jgi:quercetin dioxygenase-like cupin family protein